MKNHKYVPKLMVAQVGDSVVKDLFAGSGKIHQKNLEKIKTSLQPQSFRTRKILTIKNFTEHHPKGIGYNVIGQIQHNYHRLLSSPVCPNKKGYCGYDQSQHNGKIIKDPVSRSPGNDKQPPEFLDPKHRLNYHKAVFRISIGSLILSNLVPLIGVMF